MPTAPPVGRECKLSLNGPLGGPSPSVLGLENAAPSGGTKKEQKYSVTCSTHPASLAMEEFLDMLFGDMSKSESENEFTKLNKSQHFHLEFQYLP